MPSDLRKAARAFRKAARAVSKAAVETRVQKIRGQSSVDGEIGVFEHKGRLVVAPVTKPVEFMREELGDRETAPKGLWRKNLRHGQ